MFNTFLLLFSTIYFAYYKRLHFVLVHNKRIVVQEGSGYPRNRTSLGVFASVPAHLAMKCILQIIVRVKFIL